MSKRVISFFFLLFFSLFFYLDLNRDIDALKTGKNIHINLNSAIAAEKKPTKINGMVFILGGCFQMGDVFGNGAANERPVHEVCLNDFYIGEHEVTQAEWKEIMGRNPSEFKECGDQCPVDSVSWKDTQKYIKKLNKKTGRSYRLPTEAEWEYAARERGKKLPYAGPFAVKDLKSYGNFCDAKCDWDWKTKNQDDGYKFTAPIKSYKPNKLGLYDMTGNVWEWVSDWEDKNYYMNSPRNNPKGPEIGINKILRGGSWSSEPLLARTTFRDGTLDYVRSFNDGFRLALNSALSHS